jgi:putative flavoprotein involved in K+ transport
MNAALPQLQPQHYPALVIGGGQAGLSASYYLTQRGIPHLVFEKHGIAHEWRNRRWDSFCLVTPNWQCTLPGYPYTGPDPKGFMLKDDIVRYIEGFAASFNPPLREGVTVTRLSRHGNGHYVLDSTDGRYTADQVIVAVGGYHVPVVPRMAERLPQSLTQLHAPEYRNAEALPPGAVLVIGTGQSGCQIAEDLHLAGRTVHLCVGGAPRSPRQYRGKDAVEWLDAMGYYDITIDEHPKRDTVRSKANHYLTGRDGGREIDLRRFATEGMQLHGRLQSVDAGADGVTLRFGNDLRHNLDNADAVAESIKATIDQYIEREGITAPVDAPFQPCWQPADDQRPLHLAQAGIGSVIWCIGYRADFSWVDVPVFDGKGYPTHNRGVCTAAGLYFLGLPWQYTWGSGRFSGVARDAAHVVEQLDAHRQIPRSTPANALNELALGT